MTTDQALGSAIQLRRQVIRGTLGGTLLAVVLFVVFVVIPGPIRSPWYYVGLSAVVAATASGLFTMVLVGYRVHRLAKTIE